MKRVILAAIAATALAVVVAPSTALGAKPNNHACLGRDASAAARAAGGDFGQIIAGIAQIAPQAIGSEVQLHLAGEIPDEVFPNSCND